MARTIDEIKKEMADDFMSNADIREKYGFSEGARFSDVFSKVSIENILFCLHAVRTWVLETLFDKHAEEVRELAERKRPHTLKWYREKALAFQYGYSLSDEIAEYDNTGMTEEDVERSQIVTKCSVQTTSNIRPTLQVKAAKDDGPLNSTELQAFTSYMKDIADAGISVNCVSGRPDALALRITVLYDSLVLSSDGIAYVGGGNPVKETITRHLSNLEWNGVFYPAYLEKELMEQDGIRVAHVTRASAGPTGAQMETIGEYYEPYYGAIECDVDKDLMVTYEPF